MRQDKAKTGLGSSDLDSYAQNDNLKTSANPKGTSLGSFELPKLLWFCFFACSAVPWKTLKQPRSYGWNSGLLPLAKALFTRPQIFFPSSLSNDSRILIKRPVKLTAVLEKALGAEQPPPWAEIFLERSRSWSEFSQAEEKTESGSPTSWVSIQTQGRHARKGQFGESDPPGESGLQSFSKNASRSDNATVQGWPSPERVRDTQGRSPLVLNESNWDWKEV